MWMQDFYVLLVSLVNINFTIGGQWTHNTTGAVTGHWKMTRYEIITEKLVHIVELTLIWNFTCTVPANSLQWCLSEPVSSWEHWKDCKWPEWGNPPAGRGLLHHQRGRNIWWAVEARWHTGTGWGREPCRSQPSPPAACGEKGQHLHHIHETQLPFTGTWQTWVCSFGVTLKSLTCSSSLLTSCGMAGFVLNFCFSNKATPGKQQTTAEKLPFQRSCTVPRPFRSFLMYMECCSALKLDLGACEWGTKFYSSSSPCQERRLPEGQAKTQLLLGAEGSSGSGPHKPDPRTEPLPPCDPDKTPRKGPVQQHRHLEIQIKAKVTQQITFLTRKVRKITGTTKVVTHNSVSLFLQFNR